MVFQTHLKTLLMIAASVASASNTSEVVFTTDRTLDWDGNQTVFEELPEEPHEEDSQICHSLSEATECDAVPGCKWCFSKTSHEGSCQQKSHNATAEEVCDMLQVNCHNLGVESCDSTAGCKACTSPDSSYSFCVESDSNDALCNVSTAIAADLELSASQSGRRRWHSHRHSGGSGHSLRGSQGQVMTLYHQTSPAAARSILNSQFRPGKSGWCGGAIYFATSARATEHKAIAPSSQLGYMLKCQVNLGKVDYLNNRCNGYQNARQQGYNTIKFNPGDGDEYVVVGSPSNIKHCVGYPYKNHKYYPRR